MWAPDRTHRKSNDGVGDVNTPGDQHLIQAIGEVDDERLNFIHSPLLQLQGIHRCDEALRLRDAATRQDKAPGKSGNVNINTITGLLLDETLEIKFLHESFRSGSAPRTKCRQNFLNYILPHTVPSTAAPGWFCPS